MAVTLSLLLSAALSAPEPDWPGSRSNLASLSRSAASVVTGVARGKAEIRERHAAHLSTATTLGKGEVIRGGGIVTYAECRQKFQVRDVLRGKAGAGERVLGYSFVEKAQGFPLPHPEEPVPDGARAILFLDDKGNVLKTIPDTVWNRKAVLEALAREDEPGK